MKKFLKSIYSIPFVYRTLKNPYHMCCYLLNSVIPLKDVIVFESVPDLSDNTKAVFDEMVRRGLNEKYLFIWRVKGNAGDFEKIKNVIYLNAQKDDKLLKYYYKRARLFIICNDFINKHRFGQKSIYLSHSTTFKSIRNYYNVDKRINKILTASKDVIDLQAYELNFPKKKAVPLGFPRNDELTEKQFDLHGLFDIDYNKIIVWYPTFRQHSSDCTATSSVHSLPIIHDTNSANELNEVAAQNKVLIVLKPHFAQDVSLIKNLGLSNIIFINDDFYKEKNISSYQFVGSCDALISDYSSVYFDFTLCDKPVALVWEDIEEYKKKPGLIDNYEFYAAGGEKIYTLEQLKQFILDVAKDKDCLKEERRKIRDFVNYSTDGKNAKRVADYIIKEFKL